MTAPPPKVLRLLTAGALATGLGLVLPAGALASSFLPPLVTVAHGVSTMTLTSTQDEGMFIPKGGSPTTDFPETDPAEGDAISFSETLRQGTSAVTVVGTDKGVCNFEAFGTLACKVIVTLGDGTINAAARLAEDDTGSNVFDLVSGTGAYQGIEGKATVEQLTDTASTITLVYTVPPTQVSVVPTGGAAAGGGRRGGTDSALLIAVGVAAVAGSGGLFAAARVAARHS